MRWTFAVICFMAIMAAAAWFVFNEAVRTKGHVTVPNVVGLDVTRAQFVLAEAGLEIGKQTQVKTEQYPEYHVVLQRPAADKVVRGGKKINITISAGKEFLPAPDLAGKTLEVARSEIEAARLAIGTIARIPSTAPRDVILAQDPGFSRELLVGGEVNLLVSDGRGDLPMIMPDLLGKSVADAQAILLSLDVRAVPYMADRTDDPYDIVLDQTPDDGTLLQAGQEVRYYVRTRAGAPMANAWRSVSVEYVVPTTSASPEIRADIVDHNGTRTTAFPLPTHYVDGRPPRYAPGTLIRIPFDFQDQATLEFYADGLLNRSYYYEGDKDPVVSGIAVQPGNDLITPTDEEPLVTVFEPTATRLDSQPPNP